MANRGLYVGRFQPFHLGHLAGIKGILDEVAELVIVIGSAQYSHSLDNPFTSGERLTMTRMALEESGIDLRRIWIVPVPDVHLHMMWVSALEGYTPRFDIVYTNEPLTRRLFLEANHRVKAIPFHERKTYSSTLVREKMLKDQNWESAVPGAVASFVKRIDGVNRLRDLVKTDEA